MTLAFLSRFCCLALCSWSAVAVYGQTLAAKVIPTIDKKWLQEEWRAAQVLALDSRQLLAFAQQQQPFYWKINADLHWQLTLAADPIVAPDYGMTLANAHGSTPALAGQVQTFRGTLRRGAVSGTCYLTIGEGFVYGVFEWQAQTYFIEPARRFKQSWGEDYYLFYEADDILPNPNGRCAGALFQEKKEALPEWEKAAGVCYTVEVAMAADYKMLQLFGDATLLEKYVLAILHSVRANYDDEFNHEIRFQVATLWVSTCATCDPWGEDTNYENLLANFRDWGNANGFGRGFDVGTLWTGRVLDDNIGGGGYYGVLCGRLRYNVLRRYSENAGLMRALQAHELGHNLNARHDSTNAQTIMAPLIRDVGSWSPTSRVSINNYFNTALGLPNCISTCPSEVAPTSDFWVLQNQACAPFRVQFYNASSANATQWNWSFPGGNPSVSTAVNPLVTYEQPGIYSATLQAGNSAGTVTTTKTAFIKVKGPPVPSFSMDYQMGSTVAQFSTAVAADSLRWRWGAGNTSTAAAVTHDFQRDGAYPITLMVYNDCGADTLTQMLNVVTPPQAGFSAANVVGCAPLAVRFNNESSSNAVDFEWQFPGGTPNSSKEENPTVTYEKPGVYGVTLVARNAAGEVTRRQSNLVQVNDLPSASFSARVENNAVTLRNLSENGTFFYWNFGDGNTSSTANPVHFYQTAGRFSVQLIARNDCGSDTIVKVVEIVGLPPTAGFSATVRSGCAPLAVQFSDTSQNEPESWRWHFPGGEPSVATDPHPLVHYQNPGTYRVELITGNFFGNDTLVAQQYIEVNTKPLADFNWTAEQQTVIFQLTNGIQRGWEYAWQLGDGTSSTQPQPIHLYPNRGSYTVVLTVTNECGTDTARQSVSVGTTAVTTAAALDAVQLYPNPNDGRFYLSCQGAPPARWLVRVTNALGQVVQEREVDFLREKVVQYFDVQYLANGIYWLTLQSNTGIVKKAFVLQKP